MQKKIHILVVFVSLFTIASSAQVRSVVNFNNGWKFLLGNDSLAGNANYNDARWRSLH
ncbi:MAG: hypothetical protein GXC73_10595, partial [Chitinophagaceae bacterium]|nr:hypothetical protein [Chitinophagaceae bacterium]